MTDRDADDTHRPDNSPRPVDRRRLDEIFGDVLPSVTQDEMAEGDERAGDADRDRWYRDNRPPHHG